MTIVIQMMWDVAYEGAGEDSSVSLDRALHLPVSAAYSYIGHIPLGVLLADDLQTLQDATGVPSRSVMTNVCCTDCRQAVVDMMEIAYGTWLSSSVIATSNDKSKI
jgi:hypothetical protein